MHSSVMITGYDVKMPLQQVERMVQAEFEKIGPVVKADARKGGRAFIEFPNPSFVALAVEAFAENDRGWKVEQKKIRRWRTPGGRQFNIGGYRG